MDLIRISISVNLGGDTLNFVTEEIEGGVLARSRVAQTDRKVPIMGEGKELEKKIRAHMAEVVKEQSAYMEEKQAELLKRFQDTQKSHAEQVEAANQKLVEIFSPSEDEAT